MRHREPPLNLSPAKTLWLLLAEATVIAPHALHLPVWITAAALVLGLWRYAANRLCWRAPGRLLRAALVVAGVAGVFASYRTILGRDAGIALLVVMLALKLLELNHRRDAVLFVFLGYFLVITNFLYSQAIGLAAYMFAAVLLLTAALMSINHPGREPQPLVRMRQAGIMLLQAIPLMLLLFVLFPRIPGPLWRLPNDAHAGITGLSDSMRPGDITRLSQSNAVAFRVTFNGPVPKPAQLYWRGPVMWHFDGRGWSAGRKPVNAPPPPLTGPVLRYAVILEPTNQRWLLALDLPQSAPPQTVFTDDYQLLAKAPIRDRIRYRLVSRVLDHETPRPLSARERRAALEVPAGSNPRTRNLAKQLRRKAASAADYVRRVLAMFHDQPFVYTLQPPALGDDPVDQFLFRTRRGFCEHYASAFVVLMRDAGIPARVVTGYQGGEFNPLGGYLIVRQSNAHAWAEVWLPHQGWTRVDPTAAIAPQRVEQGLGDTLPAMERSAGATARDITLPHRLALAWDSINNGWNQWVLSYGPQLQAAFLSGFGFGRASWLGMAIALAVSLAAVALAAFLWIAWRDRPPRDPVRLAYQRLCDKLARRGFERAPSEGPLDFAQRVAAARPDWGPRVQRITQLYVALRYGEGDAKRHRRRLEALVRGFSPKGDRMRG